MRARHQELFGGKSGDHFVSRGRDYDFFFNTRRTPAIGGRPEGFESEYHAGLDGDGMFEGNQTADHRLLPDGESDAMSVLQRERGFFVREAKILSLRPHSGNLCRSSSRTHQLDGGIEIVAASFVGIDHGVRSAADGEAAVV